MLFAVGSTIIGFTCRLSVAPRGQVAYHLTYPMRQVKFFLPCPASLRLFPLRFLLSAVAARCSSPLRNAELPLSPGQMGPVLPDFPSFAAFVALWILRVLF